MTGGRRASTSTIRPVSRRTMLEPRYLATGVLHLGNALEMARALVPFAAEDSREARSLPHPVLLACREDMFVNARLIAEFFWKMPARDITARDFITESTSPLASDLARIWLIASQHVVHLSKDRLAEPSPVDVAEATTFAALSALVDTCAEAADDFARRFLGGREHSPLSAQGRVAVKGAVSSQLLRARGIAPT